MAQNNGRDINDPQVEFCYKYLAVSRADIYCPCFPGIASNRTVAFSSKSIFRLLTYAFTML